MKVDTVIFGGGIAGLWLLHELRERGDHAVLLEAAALGNGQTVASQGIIHGGLKYALTGWVNRSARNIREMPDLWRSAHAGGRVPDLSGCRLRASHCYLWRTRSMRSRLGLMAARMALRITPQTLPREHRPEPLRDCPGLVAKLDEPVFECDHLIETLAAPYRDRIFKIDPGRGLRFECAGPGEVRHIGLACPETHSHLLLEPRSVVFTAGAGNADLCSVVGLTAPKMQRRPLHMVMMRGPLPALNGHCIDGSKTRVTITSQIDRLGRQIWQIGGKIAELGVDLSPAALARHAEAEIRDVLPTVDLTDVEVGTYRVDRAEGLDPRGRRPDDAFATRSGNVTVAWPTKLALAPQLASRIRETLPEPSLSGMTSPTAPLPKWMTPEVAAPPWERQTEWVRLGASDERSANRAA